MEPESERNLKEALVPFREQIEEKIGSDLEQYVEIWQGSPMEHIENMLRDKVIVYMGDKESERAGTEEDALEIATLSYLLWSRKRNEHLI